jgi:hypothetical protein
VLGFWPSDVVLCAVQAALVLVPGPRLPAALARGGGRSWAWILPLSLGATVALLAVLPGAAPAYTDLALVGCPLLAAVVLCGGERRRLGLALLAPLALAVAWQQGATLAGQAAALALTGLSCVALATALARLAPARAIKVGIVAMAVLDAVLVFSHGLQRPNETLNAAAPGAGLPRLQVAEFGSALMGYGDLFVAAVLGAVLGARAARRRAAALTLGAALVFDALFLVTDVLPATVPVAVALVLFELGARWPRPRWAATGAAPRRAVWRRRGARGPAPGRAPG